MIEATRHNGTSTSSSWRNCQRVKLQNLVMQDSSKWMSQETLSHDQYLPSKSVFTIYLMSSTIAGAICNKPPLAQKINILKMIKIKKAVLRIFWFSASDIDKYSGFFHFDVYLIHFNAESVPVAVSIPDVFKERSMKEIPTDYWPIDPQQGKWTNHRNT